MTPDFGHHGIRGNAVFIDAWGDGPMLIRFDGREWWFEFSEMFGPTLLRKTDKEPSDRQPTTDAHPFWVPFQRWFNGGRKCRAIKTKRKVGCRVRFFLCHVPKDDGLC